MPENSNNIQVRTFNAVVNDVRNVANVIKGIAWVGIFIAGVMSIKSWLAGHTTHAALLIIFAAIQAANLLFYRWHQSYTLFKNIFLWLACTLLIYLIATGGENNTGILWFYVFPPILFYVAGLRLGCWIMAIMASLIAFILRSPDFPGIGAYYPDDFQLRFAASVSFVTIFSFVLDYSRRNAREELLSMGRLYEHAARTDELTQLPNRRDMRQHLEKEYSRYQRHGREFAVILMDLDKFKAVNDNFGHDAGDHVLSQYSEMILDTCRKTDTAARWGGEEFLVLLPDTTLAQALAMAERIRMNTEKMHTKFKHAVIQITTSCGVSSIKQAKDLTSLLQLADVLLYNAKTNGRNRIMPPLKQNTEQQQTAL